MKLCSRGHGFAAGLAVISCSALLGAMVRAKAPPGQYQYQAASDAVVDLKTRLSWQRAAMSPKTLTANSISSATYCAGLKLGGFSEGWRVPTRKELETIVDASNTPGKPTIDEDAFPDTPAWPFCTSSIPLEQPPASWVVDFALGGSYLVKPPNDVCWVRCVHSVQ
jgi:hypothetical protein